MLCSTDDVLILLLLCQANPLYCRVRHTHGNGLMIAVVAGVIIVLETTKPLMMHTLLERHALGNTIYTQLLIDC